MYQRNNYWREPSLHIARLSRLYGCMGLSQRVSSVGYPQSEAELTVKSPKRILTGNTGPSGSVNTEKVRRSLLRYKNTPLQGVAASPAQLVLGRQLGDWTPITRDKFKVSNTCIQAQHQREIALARKRLWPWHIIVQLTPYPNRPWHACGLPKPAKQPSYAMG